MMAFRIARGGYEAKANRDERNMLASLARDVVILLGSDVDHEAEQRAQFADPDDPLAALEADLVDIAEAVAAEYEPEMSMPLDQAINRLLPDMSEDPEEAAVLRNLTENSIASAKIENLVTFYQELRAVPDAGDAIFVANEQASAWLAALNDIRLVLAARLDINDADTSTAIYERAGMFTATRSRNVENLPQIETTDDMLAVMYTMTTWWQDSLVTAVRVKAHRR